jgi:hypothetical protein
MLRPLLFCEILRNVHNLPVVELFYLNCNITSFALLSNKTANLLNKMIFHIWHNINSKLTTCHCNQMLLSSPQFKKPKSPNHKYRRSNIESICMISCPKLIGWQLLLKSRLSTPNIYEK